MLPASKALRTGPYKSQVHRWFYVQEHTGGFRAHTTPPVPLSNITALVRLSNITALLPPPRTYLKSTGNCTVHKGTLRYIKMIREHTGMYKDTKYVHIKSTTVYAPRRNWDSPNPFLASECSLPPRNRGEGAHLPAGGGMGGVPIPTRGIHCGTLYMYVLCV
jgi:hypothetical protein